MKRCLFFGLLGIVWLAASQPARAYIHIDWLDLADPAAGTTMDLHGDFYEERAPEAPLEVVLYRIVDRRSVEHRLPILARSNSLIRVSVPRTIPPGNDYGMIVRIPGRWIWTNNVRVHIRPPAPPARRGDASSPNASGVTTSGMFLERVDPGEAFSGLVVSIRGRNFGSQPGGKIVGINRGGMHQARVVSWSDGLVRVVVSRSLLPGDYRVVIYYDDTLRTSSNSAPLRVVAAGHNGGGAQSRPGNTPPHYHRNTAPPPARRAGDPPPPARQGRS